MHEAGIEAVPYLYIIVCSIRLTHRPDIVVVGLVVVVDVAIVEVHVPGVRQIRPIGRRRPIVVGLDAGAQQ